MSDPQNLSTSKAGLPKSPVRRCAKCGATLAGAAGNLDGHCPECLLALGEAPVELPLNREFGGYRLLRLLGRGAMGVVYEAIQTRLHRPVALKMIVDAKLADSTARRRFMVEAEAAALLSHNNIVPIYDVGEWDGQPFLSMQLVRGESLKEKLTSGELSLNQPGVEPATVARLMVQITCAVAHAHAHGVLHRDLKPANILIDQNGDPHLTDFGLAKILGESVPGRDPGTLSGAVFGTPGYMAPEQASGGKASEASDLYSLGAIFYELLTGRPPFKAGTALATLDQVITLEPAKPRTLNKRIPKDLETICLKCLEKNPGLRYASAEALVADLQRWLQGRSIAARPASPPLRLARWCKRNPVGTALILVLCAGLMTTLALLRAKHQQEAIATQNLEALEAFSYNTVEDIWSDPNEDYIAFTNKVLGALGSYKPDLSATQLTFAMEIDGDPVSRAQAAAPVLHLIEERMRESNAPVTFNLRLQKHRPDVAAPLITGVVQIQRMGPLAYVRAKELAPGLMPLVEENSTAEAVIFASAKANVTNLSDIVGLGVAFAHSNSIISFAAKMEMARAGICAKNLREYKHLDPPRVLDLWSGKSDLSQFDHSFHAHQVVIEKVLAGDYDVGEARTRHFAANAHRGLVLLKRFKVPPRVYVVGADSAPAIAKAFQQALCSFQTRREKALLRRLFPDCQGFRAIEDKNLDYIRNALTREIRFFEEDPPGERAMAR